MTERVEEIRRELRQHREAADHSDSCEDVAMCDTMDFLLTALAQAERERDEADTERMVTSALAEAAMRDRDAARAEVERLRDVYQEQINRREADLARVRAALVFIKGRADANNVPWEPSTCTAFQDIWTSATQALAALEGR